MSLDDDQLEELWRLRSIEDDLEQALDAAAGLEAGLTAAKEALHLKQDEAERLKGREKLLQDQKRQQNERIAGLTRDLSTAVTEVDALKKQLEHRDRIYRPGRVGPYKQEPWLPKEARGGYYINPEDGRSPRARQEVDRWWEKNPCAEIDQFGFVKMDVLAAKPLMPQDFIDSARAIMQITGLTSFSPGIEPVYASSYKRKVRRRL